jgi:23S rRNA maturation mini-RNase III
MIKRKQNTKNINDQKETEHKDYQWSKGNRTQRLSMIKRKQNTKNINDQKETEQKEYK